MVCHVSIESDVFRGMLLEPRLSSFTRLLVALGLDASLREGGPFLVLAPTGTKKTGGHWCRPIISEPFSEPHKKVQLLHSSSDSAFELDSASSVLSHWGAMQHTLQFHVIVGRAELPLFAAASDELLALPTMAGETMLLGAQPNGQTVCQFPQYKMQRFCPSKSSICLDVLETANLNIKALFCRQVSLSAASR